MSFILVPQQLMLHGIQQVLTKGLNNFTPPTMPNHNQFGKMPGVGRGQVSLFPQFAQS
jgi:hypothetical protein